VIPPVRITITGGLQANPGEAIGRELESVVTELMLFLEREVKIHTPIGVTEAGRGSIAHEVRRGEAVGMGAVVGRLGSPMKHVAVINDGRRPGQKPPPAESLELWVRRKVKIERVHKAGKKKGQAKTRNGVTLIRPPTVAEAKSIAFVIARAIGRKGIEGRHFFEAAVSENDATIRRIVGRAGAEITVELSRRQ
jgi:hypothetical protein